MNLLTIAPLVDNQGKLRYFIGAQVDVSGLVKEGVNLEAFAKLAAEQDLFSGDSFQVKPYNDLKDEFQSLCEMFNQSELETTRTHGGRMHSEQHELDDTRSGRTTHRPRLRLGDTSDEQDYEASITGTHSPPPQQHNFTLSGSPGPITGKLPGVFKHYVILRPFPSLRITFTSPSLRYPGLLQSPFLSRIGGSARVRDELTSALSEGRNVTAKIRWLSSGYDESVHSNIDDHTSPTPYSSLAGKPRWIHCTPLIGSNRAIGVWMVIMIDVDEYDQEKMNHQSERNRVTSPSWSRASPSNNNNNSNNNSNNTDSRTQTSSGQTYREQKQQSQQLPIAAPSSLHNTEWDLDFDIASASVNQSTGNLPRRTESKSQRLRSQTLALAPPPSKAIPHPPLPNSNTHISDPTSSREAYSIPLTTRTSSKQQQQSPSAPSLPLSSLSTFRPRSPGPNSLQDGTLTNAIQAGFSHNIPRTPSMKSGKTSEAFAFNQTPSLQPQRYEQPQQRSNQPSKSSLRLTPKTSTDGLRKDTQSQSHTGMGLGHRVLQGFRRSSDRDKEGGAGGGGERKDRSRRG